MKERPTHSREQQEAYIESLYAADPDLEQVGATLAERGIHDISVAPGYGRLLSLLVRTSGARRIIEIGSLGGYSGICLARGLPEDGKLYSLELKQEFADLALENMTRAGLGGRVEYRVGEALAELRRFEAEGERFDFFFIDADKGNYVNYLEMAIKLGNPGALIVGDNTFLRGRTLHEEDQGQSARRIRRFNELIATHPRLESTILPAYDGLAIARLKS
ncbi:O-methyltransferase [Gorillibacterium sp. sgz5001074]|uniref:O-methyltransferase n=1 Tax=Gorillibacterium sp. sgz5001074 TaxID=3446695 RepID=UPI003F672380